MSWKPEIDELERRLDLHRKTGGPAGSSGGLRSEPPSNVGALEWRVPFIRP